MDDIEMKNAGSLFKGLKDKGILISVDGSGNPTNNTASSTATPVQKADPSV